MRPSIPLAAVTAFFMSLAPAGAALADRDDHRRGHHDRGDHGRYDRDRYDRYDRDRHDRGHYRGHDRDRHDYYRPGPPPRHYYRPPPVVHYHVHRPHHWHGHYGHRWQHLPNFYALNIGIDGGRCDRRMVGSNVNTLLGAVAGGLAGSTIGDGRGQAAATLGGVLVGAAIGNSLSGAYSYGAADYGCVAQTFERAPTGQPIVWDNPDLSARYVLTPTRTYEAEPGRYCREYTSEALVGNQPQQVYGTACRQPDGSWEIVG